MSKLIPVLLLVLGTAAGGVAGSFLRPETAVDETGSNPAETPETMAENEDAKQTGRPGEGTDLEFVRLNNQFVVPVLSDQTVTALVVVSLSIEVDATQTGPVYSAEPKLRDAFLQVLFDHANIGGFHGEFTNSRNMDILREALTNTARNILGESVSAVLITDLARQDV